MERLCVVIFEISDTTKKTLRDVLAAYAIEQNVEIVIKWLKTPIEDNAIYDACVEANIALVNVTNSDDALHVGQLLHKINSECSLIYYGNAVKNDITNTVNYFSRLIATMPIRYLHCPNLQNFMEVLSWYSSMEEYKAYFMWETKGMIYRIPYESIRYFRSDRNYVYVHLQNGVEYSFLCKLSIIEKQLPKKLFIRVHQSYLVNQSEIVVVDKQKRTIFLRNGEELFISKAHYRETIDACRA